jgi:tRNA(Ile)-lysidine synthase
MSEWFSKADLSALPEQGSVVVGFSAGADSTALAHWLLGRIAPERLVLAHVNHLLRGEESERDEAAAREFAGRYGLRFAVFRENVAALAKSRGQGLEECGRQVRYEWFQSLAQGREDRILTAHHCDDNAETVLLHLCRGTSLPGLLGIPYQRGKVVRPFLQVTHQEILDYCAAMGLDYVTDSTNLSHDYARNRLRWEVLPVLEELNPGFLSAITRMTATLSQDQDCLEAQARFLLESARVPQGLDAGKLRQAHPALTSRALLLYWRERAGEEPSLEKKHLDALLACLERGGEADLPGGVEGWCSQGVFSLEEPCRPAGFCVTAGLGETLLPCGKRLNLRVEELPAGGLVPKIHNLLFKNALDYDIITGNLKARSRRAGDRFPPAGRRVTKTLKQLFQENKVPEPQRDRIVLLEDGGRPVFCEGVGPAEGFQVTPSTRRALVVELRQEETT